MSGLKKFAATAALLAASSALAMAPGHGSVMPRVRIVDFRSGQVMSDMECTIVYIDGYFYSESETHKIGEFRQGAMTEGTLSAQELQQMNQLLDDPKFAALQSPMQEKRMMQEDQHLVEISVPRSSGLQDLVYETDKARKPADATLKPLMGWWKTLLQSHPANKRTNALNQCQYQVE